MFRWQVLLPPDVRVDDLEILVRPLPGRIIVTQGVLAGPPWKVRVSSCFLCCIALNPSRTLCKVPHARLELSFDFLLHVLTRVPRRDSRSGTIL
jgi:hypothetical protein